MKINIPREVERALSILHNKGFEAYIVGGCVRDSIMGNFPSDWDITTSAKPDEIMSAFSGFRTIETGIKHGTVAVIIDKMQIEITTYRIDGDYSDKRHPDRVFFTDNLKYDLERRDFTINALAYNGQELVDLFGGINDIEKKIIRCVGDPHERFNEDGLRILRALRFASVLNFEIEKNTSASIHHNKNLLNSISKERINTEFNKLVMGTSFQRILGEYRNIIQVFIPELSSISPEEAESRLKAMGSVDTLVLRLSLLLYKMESPDRILMRLKYDNTTIKGVKLLTANMEGKIYPEPVNIKKWLYKISYVNLCDLIKLKKALFKFQCEELSKAEKIMDEIIETKQCYSLETLALGGQDLLDLGIPRGKDIGRILNELLDKVIEGQLENNKDSLLKYVYVNREVLCSKS